MGGLLSHNQPSGTPDRKKKGKKKQGRQKVRRGEQLSLVSTTHPAKCRCASFRFSLFLVGAGGWGMIVEQIEF